MINKGLKILLGPFFLPIGVFQKRYDKYSCTRKFIQFANSRTFKENKNSFIKLWMKKKFDEKYSSHSYEIKSNRYR